MSQLSREFSAAIAVSLLCVAWVAPSSSRRAAISPEATPSSSGASEALINRAAKADRAARLPAGAVQTRTVSVRLYGLAAASVVVRIPVAREARNAPSVPLVTRSGDRKSGASEVDGHASRSSAY